MIAKFIKNNWFPLLILFVCFLAYGLFIPFQGFYWDDFPYMWFKHTTGIAGVVKALALDRPVLGIFYTLPMAILGETPWIWQVFAIVCRFIFILSVFGFLNRIFPDRRKENKFLILLFSVFPGFTQQWISVVYSHAFLIFALYFYSLSLFVDQINKDTFKWFCLIAPISMSLISLMATEYMLGMEVIRPFILFKIISGKFPNSTIIQKLKKTLSKWLPFLGATLIFVFYRVFIASSVLYKVQNLDALMSTPWVTFLNFTKIQFLNIYTSTLLAWGQVFDPIIALDFTSLFSKVYLAVTIFAFLVSLGLLLKLKPSLSQGFYKDRKWAVELFVGSVIVLFFVGMPFWAANLRPEIQFPNDRILIPFMLGSSALVFLLVWLFKNKKLVFYILISLIFSLSLGYQVFQANNYRTEWDYFKQFFEQISWRIPSLEPDTILVTDELPLHYYSDNSLTAAFNWLYTKDNENFHLPYLIFYTKARLGKSLVSLSPHTEIKYNFRIDSFKGSTDRMILFYHNPPGCVHLADPDIDIANPLISKEIRPSVSLSKLGLVNNEEKKNSVFFVENKPFQSWCYYYQKASLAVQNKDWETAVKLGDIAFNLKDYPNDASERLPFVEAYAMTGDWEKAVDLSNQTIRISALYQPMVCKVWERIYNNLDPDTDSMDIGAQEFFNLNCKDNT